MHLDPIIRFEGLTKTYPGGAKAVLGLDLAIERGQMVALLGPSGCGKTTTLRMLGGFETPEAGRVYLEGRDITALPPEARAVNMLFQDYALFPHLTVAENVGFGLQMRKMPKAAIKARVAELLALVALEDFAARKPAQLSGGQRQRVALARALAPDPAVLLLDEPLAALDAKLRAKMQFELKALQRRTGKTFLFVTHDQEEALALADRVIVMNHGRIEQSGTPEELYHAPATPFVAGFVGTSSRVEGRVVAENAEGIALEAEGLRISGQSLGAGLGLGQRAEAYLRPEQLVLSDRPEAARGRLLGRAFLGGRSLLEIGLPSGATLLLESPSGAAEPEIGADLGFEVRAKTTPLFAI